MKQFDIEKLERKNIYTVPDNIFENIQERVMSDVKEHKKAPIFNMNRAYVVAASLALIFGITFVLSNEDSKNTDPKASFALNKPSTNTESEVVYNALQADQTSYEKSNQDDNQQYKKFSHFNKRGNAKNKTKSNTSKATSKLAETQINEYLDTFSNSEIAELASNSTSQDIYLDIYN